ncbi:LEA type 2 family protein [Aquimarina sp. M1]
MKKFLLLSTILTCIISCSVSRKPEFKYISNIEVKNVSMRNVTLKADAIFHNPNNLSGKLSLNDIHIFVDNIDMGTISSQSFDVPPKREFIIPIEGKVSLSKIYSEYKNNLLGSVLKIVQTDSLLVHYKGNILYNFGSFSYPYNIDKEQKIRLK